MHMHVPMYMWHQQAVICMIKWVGRIVCVTRTLAPAVTPPCKPARIAYYIYISLSLCTSYSHITSRILKEYLGMLWWKIGPSFGQIFPSNIWWQAPSLRAAGQKVLETKAVPRLGRYSLVVLFAIYAHNTTRDVNVVSSISYTIPKSSLFLWDVYHPQIVAVYGLWQPQVDTEGMSRSQALMGRET